MELGREGGLSGTGPVTVSGSLDLHLRSPDMSKVAIQLSHAGLGDTQFKPHPNVDKPAWTKSSIIKMRDANKGFPIGQDVKVLRWKMTKNDDSLIPLSSAYSFDQRSLHKFVPDIHTWLCYQSTAGPPKATAA